MSHTDANSSALNAPEPRREAPRAGAHHGADASGAPYLLYADMVPPGDVPGTPVVTWRHVLRFEAEGWRVRVAAAEATSQREPVLPSWDFIPYPPRRRWWPPHRDEVAGSMAVRAWLQGREVVARLNGDVPDVVLTVLSPEHAPIAAAVARRLKRPLAVIVHDQPELWEEVVRRPDYQPVVQANVERVLRQAARVYPVTRMLGEAYGPEVAAKAVPLLPIPAGGERPEAVWQDRFVRPHVVHAGSLHPFQRPNFLALARALQGVGGRLTVISHHDTSPFDDLASAFDHVTLRPAFPTSGEVLDFCAAEASAMLVSYSFTEQPWAATSFPSKMVEFAHLGLPQLLLSPPHAAVSIWAREQSWTSHVESLDAGALAAEVAALATPEGWVQRAADAHRAARGPFNPATIHAGLATSLSTLIASRRSAR